MDSFYIWSMYPSSDSHRLNLESQNVSEEAQTADFENDTNIVVIDNHEPSQQHEESALQMNLIEENASFHNNDEEPETRCLITPGLDYSDDFCFTISEDSLVLPDTNYVTTENIQSTSYSNSKQLHISCEEASSHDPLQPSILFSDSVQAVDEDFFMNNGEESSMDSGLGSVESVYPTSEDDTVLSPTYCNKSEEDDEVVEEPSTTSASERTEPRPAYDKSNNATTSTTLHSCHNSYFENELKSPISSRSIISASARKRHIEDEGADDDGPTSLAKVRRKGKRVNFQDVTVFYFPRKQGFVSVPSQGGSTLGMAMNHTEFSTMTLTKHDCVVKERHEAKLREHWKEQNLAKEMLQFQYMNQGFTSDDMTAVSQSNLCSNEEPSNPLEGLDQYFFLQPITAKKRRKLLRSAGVERIDGEEKLANRLLRESREMCGCSCETICVPDSCECSQAGIQCQVDRESFPCGCIASGCQNENGRIEFNPERVRTHLLATLKKFEEQDESGEEVASDTDKSTECSGSEDGSVPRSEEDALLADHESLVSEQELKSLPRLPDSLLKTLQLERVDNFTELIAENHCITSEYVAQTLPSISDFVSCPVSHVGATEEPYLEATNSTVPDISCKSWHGHDVGLLGHIGELTQTGGVLSPSVQVSNVLNESFPDIRYDRGLSLDPIDTFMSSNFVTPPAPDVSSSFNFDSSL